VDFSPFRMPEMLENKVLGENVLPMAAFAKMKVTLIMGGLTLQENDSEAYDNQTE
jgi:hypothetical protein